MSTPNDARPKARILVIEDDPSIAMGLRMNLETEGYRVTTAEDGVTGLQLAREGADLVILDIMLPKLHGFEVLRTLRGEGNTTPVIVLSARTSEMDKVTGLELGSEDYVTKPFSLAELLARIRAVLRRAGPRPAPVWHFGEVTVNPQAREVHRGDEAVELTSTEFDVLTALAERSGEAVTREEIFQAVWGPNHHGTLRTIDNFIAQLRAKLEADPSSPQHLVTVRGVGYRLAQ